MWIDVLAINQQDLQERAQQVAIMADIYRNARCVDIWLGEPELPASIRWRSVRRALIRSSDIFVRIHLRERLPLTIALAWDKQIALNSALQHTEPRCYDRVCVIQEFLFARRLCLRFGPHKWKHLQSLRAASEHPELRREHASLEAGENFISDLQWRLHTGFKEGREKDLIGIVPLTDVSSATDERDRIYSISGLLTPKEVGLIGVDYTLSFAQVCARATCVSMIMRGDHTISHWAPANNAAHRSGWPSWVVDFSDTAVFEIIERLRDRRNAPGRHADLGRFQPSEQALFPPVQVNTALDRLTFTGVKCGRITATCNLGEAVGRGTALAWLHDAVCRHFAQSSSPAAKALLDRALLAPLEPVLKARQPIPWYGEAASQCLAGYRRMLVCGQDDMNELFCYWDELAQALFSGGESGKRICATVQSL